MIAFEEFGDGLVTFVNPAHVVSVRLAYELPFFMLYIDVNGPHDNGLVFQYEDVALAREAQYRVLNMVVNPSRHEALFLADNKVPVRFMLAEIRDEGANT